MIGNAKKNRFCYYLCIIFIVLCLLFVCVIVWDPHFSFSCLLTNCYPWISQQYFLTCAKKTTLAAASFINR